MARHKLLSTKKLQPSLIAWAGQKSIEIIEQEFISVKPIWSEEKIKEVHACFFKPFVAFTSAHAVEITNSYLHIRDTYYIVDWKIFCLSGKTKEAVFAAHSLKNNIVGEAENAAALAQVIIEQKVPKVVFFCGNKRRDTLPKLLNEANIVVQEVVVYETMETPTITTENLDGILFFSPSAVHSFFSVNNLSRHTVCFAIGDTTADVIKDFTNNRVLVSEHPDASLLLATADFYFQNNTCYE